MTRRAADQAAVVNRWREVADVLARSLEDLLDTSPDATMSSRCAAEHGAIEALTVYKEALDA